MIWTHFWARQLNAWSFVVLTLWKDVKDLGPVPYWIHSVEEGLQGNDPKFAEQMEAFFFGFQFDNIPLEKYFDKSRFTEAFLKEDFNLQEIEQLRKRDIKD